MAQLVQLDLFVQQDMQERLMKMEKRLEIVERSTKGLFARYHDVEGVVMQQATDIERLNKNVFENQVANP